MMFSPDVEDGIERFAKQEELSREEALAQLVRDWMIGQGFIEAEDEDVSEE